MEQIIKGFSHEKFKIGESHIFKYTNDPKRFDFVRRQYNWLNNASKEVPNHAFKYIDIIEDENTCGYVMERIKNPEQITVADVPDIIEGLSLIKTFWPPDVMLKANTNTWSFATYVDYVSKIIIKNIDIFDFINIEKFKESMMSYQVFANENNSYCHGDLTTDNILKVDDRLIFIDPNYRSDIWQSYLLDIAKLYQETLFTDYRLFDAIKSMVQTKFSFTDEEMKFIDLLHITHYVRMIPYVQKFPDLYKMRLARLKELYIKQIK